MVIPMSNNMPLSSQLGIWRVGVGGYSDPPVSHRIHPYFVHLQKLSFNTHHTTADPRRSLQCSSPRFPITPTEISPNWMHNRDRDPSDLIKTMSNTDQFGLMSLSLTIFSHSSNYKCLHKPSQVTNSSHCLHSHNVIYGRINTILNIPPV